MAATFTERVRTQVRHEVLDAAVAVMNESGWHKLRMQALAQQVGVSRRTLYNEFGSKPELAQALVERSVNALASIVRAVFPVAPDIVTAWVRMITEVLTAADEDPVLRAVFAPSSGTDFLPLLTSKGDYALDFSAKNLREAILARWPEVPEDHAAAAAGATVRLVISHFVQARGTRHDAAREIAAVVAAFLTPESGTDLRPVPDRA